MSGGDRKIGLFGGTFDPVHNGHLIIAEFLRDELGLDEIWFIPAKIHPLKNNQEITPASHRLKMLELAVAGNRRFRVNDVELKREGVSYTIDTLNELREQYRDISPRFYLFIGMDNVNDLYRWREPHQVLEKSQVVAFGRPGFQPDERAKQFLPRIKFIHVPLLEISSTFIRERIRKGRSVRYLIPDEVNDYVVKNKLYR